MLHDFAAGIGRLSRLRYARRPLVLVAQLKGGKPLHEQCETRQPRDPNNFATQRQLPHTRWLASLAVMSLEHVHVRQTDSARARSGPAALTPIASPFEPDFPSSNSPRFVQNQQRAGQLDPLLGKG